MKQPEDFFEVTFSGKDYSRTVLCLGVPRLGDLVAVDQLQGRVAEVIWNVTSGKPNARSVTIYVN